MQITENKNEQNGYNKQHLIGEHGPNENWNIVIALLTCGEWAGIQGVSLIVLGCTIGCPEIVSIITTKTEIYSLKWPTQG